MYPLDVPESDVLHLGHLGALLLLDLGQRLLQLLEVGPLARLVRPAPGHEAAVERSVSGFQRPEVTCTGAAGIARAGPSARRSRACQ